MMLDKISLIVLGVLIVSSCNKLTSKEKLSGLSLSCASVDSEVIESKKSCKIYIVDSIDFYDMNFHAENMVYSARIVFQNDSINEIDYVIKQNGNEKKSSFSKETVMLNISWLENHKGYIDLFKFLRNDVNFRRGDGLIYSYSLTKIDEENVFEGNIYNLLKTCYSYIPEESAFALKTLENLRIEMSKNKFGTIENLAKYDAMVEKINAFNRSRLNESGNEDD